MSEVKRYSAVKLRYDDSNISYGNGCEVEVVVSRDYDRLAAENVQLRRLCAELYQVLGALDAPANILDKVSAAASGEPIPNIELLPFAPMTPATPSVSVLVEALEKFVEIVRGCEQLASDYSGCLDGVDERGGDDHEDPICAVFHRLYYAMFDIDAALADHRAKGGE